MFNSPSVEQQQQNRSARSSERPTEKGWCGKLPVRSRQHCPYPQHSSPADPQSRSWVHPHGELAYSNPRPAYLPASALSGHRGVRRLGGDRAGGLQALCSIWPAQDVLKLELRVLLDHADTTRFLPLQLM